MEVESFSLRNSRVTALLQSELLQFVVSMLLSCSPWLVIVEPWCNRLVCTSCKASSAGAADVAIHMPLFVMTACLKTLALG